MRKETIGFTLQIFGCTATAFMTLSAVAMIVTNFLCAEAAILRAMLATVAPVDFLARNLTR